MVASIYSEMLAFEEVGGDMLTRLGQMNVAHIFLRIAKYYEGQPDKFNKALFYILHTYSFKSKFHILGSDWKQTKMKVAEHVGLDENFTQEYCDLVLLESQAVVETIQDYLNYQGERSFKHLIMLKDLYEQMVAAALSDIKKASLETDYDQKYRNHDYATKLLAEINEWEQRVAEGNRELKEAMMEVQADKGRIKKSLRMEDNMI